MWHSHLHLPHTAALSSFASCPIHKPSSYLPAINTAMCNILLYIYCMSAIWATDMLSSLSSLPHLLYHRHFHFLWFTNKTFNTKHTKYLIISCCIPINFLSSAEHNILRRGSTLPLMSLLQVSHIIPLSLLHKPLQAFHERRLYIAQRTCDVVMLYFQLRAQHGPHTLL